MKIYSDVPTLFRHESWIPVKLVESWQKCFILETRCHGLPEGWKYLIFNHFIEQFTKKKKKKLFHFFSISGNCSERTPWVQPEHTRVMETLKSRGSRAPENLLNTNVFWRCKHLFWIWQMGKVSHLGHIVVDESTGSTGVFETLLPSMWEILDFP